MKRGHFFPLKSNEISLKSFISLIFISHPMLKEWGHVSFHFIPNRIFRNLAKNLELLWEVSLNLPLDSKDWSKVISILLQLLGTVFRLGVENPISFFWWVCHAVSYPCKHGHHVVKGKLRSVGADLLSPLLWLTFLCRYTVESVWFTGRWYPTSECFTSLKEDTPRPSGL
jgi:hypothetical protein